jgi:hypothetical protein
VRIRAFRLRLRIFAAATVAAMASAIGGAQAQNYPWCSNFADGAGTNCGFSTLAQCKAEIAGSGGYCDRNNLYVPPAGAAPAAHKGRRGHARPSS